ncbi:MAG: heme ABC transporter permease [Thalassobaculales bacterium]
MIDSLANPARFQRFAARAQPAALWLAGLALGAGLWLALAASPPDYQQGETVRIMYIHVPAAWLAMAAYTGLAVCGVLSLVWKHPLADVAAAEMAPLGAAFTVLALATGMLWGKPMWGAWWVWDARLTSVLILLFLYFGHMALTRAFDDAGRGLRAAAVLAIVGWVNVPIIKFSVDWWNTLHQPASVLRLAGPAIHPSMLWPLGLMALGYTALFAGILMLRMRAHLMERRVRALGLARVTA